MAAPLQTLRDRHRLIALYEVQGWTVQEIAAELGVSAGSIYALRQSPLYAGLLDHLRKKIESKTTFSIASAISADAEHVYRRKRELMDQDENLPVANSAADSFLDRLEPKRSINEHDTSVRVRVSVEDVRYFEQVLAEDEAVTVPGVSSVPQLAATLEREERAAAERRAATDTDP